MNPQRSAGGRSLRCLSTCLLAALAAFGATVACPPAAAQSPSQPSPPPAAAARPAPPRQLDMGLKFELEPRAVEILKTTSAKLAAAKTLRFTAVATYESPARTGQPLAYMSEYEVVLERPNKLRVLTRGDGPASEFYYDGRKVMAYAPQANLVAVAQAPPTIDEMLKAAYDVAGIYFPFTDLVVSDPYKDMSEGLKLAFFVGQSRLVGDTTTDIVVVANDTVQVQMWIGAEDKLPRMARATYFDEPGNFRHQVVFSGWQLNRPVPSVVFASAKAAAAPRMRFAAPADAAPQPAQTEGRKP